MLDATIIDKLYWGLEICTQGMIPLPVAAQYIRAGVK